MLLELDVQRLVVSDIHEMHGCATLLDHAQSIGVLGVVKSSEDTVVNAEAIAPEVKCSLLDRAAGGGGDGGDGARGVGNGATDHTLAAQGLTGAVERGGCRGTSRRRRTRALCLSGYACQSRGDSSKGKKESQEKYWRVGEIAEAE